MRFYLNISERFFGALCVLAVAMLVPVFDTFSQTASRQSFQFLNVPVSSRVAGLSGVNVSLADTDVNLVFSNPALIGDTLAGVASVDYQFYVADIRHSGVVYTTNLKKAGIVTFGVQHMNYGTVKSYDDTGAEIGDFHSSETSLNISKSHQVGNYRLGATLRGVFSNLAGFRASGMCVDIGGLFVHPQKSFTIGLAVKNAGFVFSDYSSTANTTLPFDVQVGTTFKPVHMPIRFSLTAYNLVDADAAYDDPAAEEDNSSLVKDVLNHIGIGGDILFHRNVNMLLGYNFMNHQTLKLEQGGGGAGLTLGLVVKIKKFELVMSRAAYVAGNAAYTFTLSGNLNKMLKKI